MTLPDIKSSPQHLQDVLGYLSAWAGIELMHGLLHNPRLLELLLNGTETEDLVQASGLTHRQVSSMMLALEAEGFVEDRVGLWHLTALGAAFKDYRGWVDIFLDGYGDYYRNASELWRNGPQDAWRNMGVVGSASIEISRYGALPLTVSLIEEFVPDPSLVVDCGCADATYLVELARRIPDMRGVGVEPADALRRKAVSLIADAGLEDRLNTAASIGELPSVVDRDPDCVVFAFVLHEFLEQDGRASLIDMLRDLAERYPRTTVVAVEVDVSPRTAERSRMRSDSHLRGYYSPYFWLHDFTHQRLLTSEEWRKLFVEAGYHVTAERPIDATFDATRLEVGFVLKPGG